MLTHGVFKFETCSVASGMLFVFIDIAIISAALQSSVSKFIGFVQYITCFMKTQNFL
jgi:hypothetical protein